MNIITHALVGWVIGQRVTDTPKQAALITVASVAPDIDALGIIPDLINGGEAVWFSKFHHILGHNLTFCLLLTGLVSLVFRTNLKFLFWFFIVFHLHLFCDIIGGRGPDGYQWPIPYLYPFSNITISWSGQWMINAWPNIVFTVALIALFIKQSIIYQYSFISLLSEKADKAFVMTLANRFSKEVKK